MKRTHHVEIMPGSRAFLTGEKVIFNHIGTPRAITATSSEPKDVTRIRVCCMSFSSKEIAAAMMTLHP